MDNLELIELIKSEFKKDIEQVFIRGNNRAQLQVKRDRALEIAEWLYREQGFRYIISSASDLGDKFEIVYHFSYDKTGLILNLQVFLPYEKPEIESLAPLIVAADWIEREMHELFGIRFLHHPNLVPFLSDGNWEADEFPYARKTPKNE